MSVRITVLGLRRLGASLALALGSRDDLEITGFDRDAETARLAQRRGAPHKVAWNLIQAVEQADLVLLALPVAEQREALKTVASDLREGSVVATMAPLLGPPLAWAAELLPARSERHFVACHPILNPAQLHSGQTGLDAASAELFQHGLWALATTPDYAPEALRLAADLARLLGASPYFVDPFEHDGLVGVADGLPVILAWALMQAATASPGWSETRKVADRGFATATFAIADAEPSALLHNRDSVLRYLDAALVELQTVRRHVETGDAPALRRALDEAADLRAKWLAERQRGDWEALEQPQVEMPSAGEMMGRLFTGGLFARKGGQRKDV